MIIAESIQAWVLVRDISSVPVQHLTVGGGLMGIGDVIVTTSSYSFSTYFSSSSFSDKVDPPHKLTLQEVADSK